MPDNQGQPLHFSGPADKCGAGMAAVYHQLREGLIGKSIADLTFGECDDGTPGEYIVFAFTDGTSFRLETEATYFPAPLKSDDAKVEQQAVTPERFGTPRPDLGDHPSASSAERPSQ